MFFRLIEKGKALSINAKRGLICRGKSFELDGKEYFIKKIELERRD